jgi:hypothetical protein
VVGHSRDGVLNGYKAGSHHPGSQSPPKVLNAAIDRSAVT